MGNRLANRTLPQLVTGLAARGLACLLAGGMLLGASATPAWSWGPAGHRVVARIAMEYLSPKAQKRLRFLLGADVSPEQAANWADEIREQRPETSPWHYINIPPAATSLDLKRDCPDRDCITVKIREFSGIVRLSVRTRSEVQESLKFLIHLVADLHQPLHAGYLQDRGGNEIAVIVSGQETNLHALWDSDLVRQLGSDEVALAERLQQAITSAQKHEWQQGNLRDWTWESHLLAVRYAYGALPRGNPKRLDAEYLGPASTLVEQQLSKAGVRLAKVINETWP